MKYAPSFANRRLRLLLSLRVLLAAFLGWVATDKAGAEPNLRTTCVGHSAVVYGVAFSPDGKTLASASGEQTIKVWDVATGKELATLKGHKFAVFAVTYSPDGKTLASASQDGTIKLWDVATGKELTTLNGHRDLVSCLAYAPDGKTLASGSADQTIKLWDMTTGKELATLKGHTDEVRSVAYTRDGKKLASGSEDNTIKLWDVAARKELATFQGHADIVFSVAYSGDDKTLASGSKDKTIKLWDVATGKELATLRGHTEGVISVAYSPDGKTLASGSVDKTIKLWDLATGKEQATLKGHTDVVYSVAFSRNGRVLASGSEDATIKLWDLQNTDPNKKEPDDKEPTPKQRVEDEDKPPKQRREEEEDTPAQPPTRKIRFEEEDPKAKVTRPGVNPSGDFNQLARETKDLNVQALYRKLAVPYDVFNLYRQDNSTYPKRATPVEQFYGGERGKQPAMLQVAWLDETNKPGKPQALNPSLVKSIDPYELAALTELDQFHKKHELKKYEQLLIDEQVLSGVMRFHGSAKQSGLRKGDWSAIEIRLRSRLMEVLLEQLGLLTTSNDWNSAFALAARIADSFPGDNDQKVIAPRILELLKKALAAKQGPNINSDQLRDVHLRLRALVDRFPADEEMQKLKKSLKEEAESLVRSASDLLKSPNEKDLETAQNRLRQAEELWPTLESLEPYREKIRQKFPILRVGVRQLPKYMSPQTAITDTELRAVEMIFESLVKFSPNASGMGRYHVDLAEGRPQVVELGRQFQLPTTALWWDPMPTDGSPPTKPLRFEDIRATFRALQVGDGPEHSLAWENLYADKVVSSSSNALRVSVHLNKGYIEPLSLMNAKIVPAWALKGKPEDFGMNPVGSGPFGYAGAGSEGGRSYIKFVANPYYRTRGGKLDPPFREVRLFIYNSAVKEVQEKQLNMLLDVTADEAAAIKKDSASTRFNVALPTAKAPNHRVYFLAVNHRQRPLNDVNVRAALSLAINREKLLDDVYRGALKREVHRALNSPYPANCWACDPKEHSHSDANSCDPFDARMARRKLRDAEKNLPGDELKLTLKYPDGDPALANAMTALAAQVQDILKEVRPVKIEPMPVPVDTLKKDLETTNFELAYCHYDFPDDTFWLGPLFAPKKPLNNAANPQNTFGFDSQVLMDELKRSIDFREFAEMQICTQKIHKILEVQVPVIPLWQLDPLHAIHQDVKTTPFDPQRVFTDIEKWRLK